MIEVEKKFRLNEVERECLLEGAVFESERSFTDVYYDTPDYTLTRKDTWLRFRDGRCELKVPRRMDDYSKNAIDQYEELLTEQEIRQHLRLPIHTTFREDLEYSGYHPIGTITTHRKAYRKEGFVIDIDCTDTGYSIGEIELLVEDEVGMEEATQKIIEFAKRHTLAMIPVRGKVMEYIRVNNPQHFQILIDAGVFSPLTRP